MAFFTGPRLAGYSAVDADDLALYRQGAPGFENAFLMLSAPQLGVRHARRLRLDEIGVSPSLSPNFPNVSVPYGALAPERLDGHLAPGRHVSCDSNSHSFLREIPQCWLTGQAAGVAAAMAVDLKIPPRDISILELQAALKAGGAHLSEARAAQSAA